MTHEIIKLTDGETFLFREPVPADRDKLLQGFENLSNSARYSRFLYHKSQLSDSEIVKFLEPASDQHYSIAALNFDETLNNEGIGVGIAHLFVMDELPEIAEVAVTIIDEYQNRGFARILLKHIELQAKKRNIKYLRFNMLAENSKMQKRIRSMDWQLNSKLENGIVECDAYIGENEPLC